MTTPFDLNLRHLRAIGTIVREGGMNSAADAIGISQPALTQGVAKLEAQLGAPLFERRPDGMAATAEGRIFADRIAAAFDHLAVGARNRGRGFARPEQLVTATQARAFLALSDSGSFVSAAAATGISQPALHRAVRDLEQVIGTALVERRGRGVALNGAGHRLARGIRLAAAEIAAGIAEISVQDSGRIIIGAMPLSRAILLPRAVARLAAERPGMTISIVEGSWRELVEPLRDGAVDLMVGALRPQDIPDLSQAALHEDHLVVAAGAGHPLAGRRDIGLEALLAFPWIVGPPGSPLRGQWQTLFGQGPLPPHPIECGSVMTIRGLLTDGEFLTLLSPDQIALEVKSGLLTHIGRPLEGTVRRIGVTTRRDWRPMAGQTRFLELLRDVASEFTIRDFE